MIWVDGLAGHDITDGHIDTLARFVNPATIIIDKPAFEDPSDPWIWRCCTGQQIGRPHCGGQCLSLGRDHATADHPWFQR